MSVTVEKYLHRDMDKQAGIEHTFHGTKIVATVGPACDTYDKLLELVKAGLNVFRLTFAHGARDDKSKIIEHLGNINTTETYNLSILADVHAPQLKVRDMENGGST